MVRSLIADRASIPMFHLPGREGRVFDTYDLNRKKNIVLFILSQPAAEFLIKVEESYAALRGQNAEVVVICPHCEDEIEEIHKRNRLSFWILSDPDNGVIDKFIAAPAGEAFCVLFIADRFGEVFFQYQAPHCGELPSMEEIARSLVFIESQCPECGGGS